MKQAHKLIIGTNTREPSRLASRTVGCARRMIVGIIGLTVLAAGVAMIILPGPAVIVIPCGFGILATEYAWARTVLAGLKNRAARLKKGSSCLTSP